MICEKKQIGSIPFDVSSFVIRQYARSEEDIPYKKVNRFRTYLAKIVRAALSKDHKINDSPGFIFIGNELNNIKNMKATTDDKTESFADLLKKAEALKNQKYFLAALNLFGRARMLAEKNMALIDKLTFIISRQALCTYKSKQPNELEALVSAKSILVEFQPQQHNDVEVLGLTGAINKRLFKLTLGLNYLNNAISAYQKGFELKQDYYNGINASFMLYIKTELLKSHNEEWEDEKLNADYIRNAVLKIALNIEKEDGFQENDDAIWVLLTIAEAYHYKGKNEFMISYENKAKEMAIAKNNIFAMSSYNKQKDKIRNINVTF